MSNTSAFVDNLSFEVYDTLEKIYRTLSKDFNKYNNLGYTCGQGKLLRFLHENGESTQSQLSLTLGITPSSVSEISDKLLNAGFITKTSDVFDKRKSYLSITQSGVFQLQQLKNDFFDFISSSFSALSSDELSELHRLLLKLSPEPDNVKQNPVTVQTSNIRRGTRL